MVLIELFLDALILDEFNDIRLGEDLLAQTLKMLQGRDVDVFNFYGDDVTTASKFHNGIIVCQFSIRKLCYGRARRVLIRIEYRKRNVKINTGLNKHPAQLSAAQYAELKILLKETQGSIF